jgi:hypothetical protein
MNISIVISYGYESVDEPVCTHMVEPHYYKSRNQYKLQQGKLSQMTLSVSGIGTLRFRMGGTPPPGRTV